MRLRLFLDSSVLFAAAYSKHGHSYDLVHLAIDEQVALVTSPVVLDVQAAARHVVLKDAPILAAARKAKVDYLVTLDKKHLLGKPELAQYARTIIATPQEVVQSLTPKKPL